MTSLDVEEESENVDDMFEFVDIDMHSKDTNQTTAIVDNFEIDNFKVEKVELNIIKVEADFIKAEVDVKDEASQIYCQNNNVPIRGSDKKYSCPFCDYKTKRGEECQEHINGIHTHLKPYVCTHENCSFATSYRGGLRKHVQYVHENRVATPKPKPIGPDSKRYFCDQCDFKTNKNCYLTEHVNGVHENIKPYACTVEGCSYATSYRGGLKKHTEAVHLHIKHDLREKKWMCNYCDYRTRRERYLKEHIMAKHENNRPFVCTYDQCKYATVNGNSLKKHIDSVHLKIKDNICDQCDFTTFSKKMLQLHVLSKHEDTKPFSCSYVGCTYATVYASSIKSHTERVHLNMRPFICDRENCKYATNDKQRLKQHINAVHEKTLRFSCEYSNCDYKANFKSNMKLHVNKVHLKLVKEELHCEACDYKTRSPQMLKWHFSARHTDAVQKCPHCSFESKWYTSVKSHIKIVHEGAKSFRCDLCEYECPRRDRLKTHYNAVHLGISHQCPECPMKSNWKHKIDLHYKEVHDNQNIPSYFCDQCDFQTFRRWKLEPHHYFHHGEGLTIEFLKDNDGCYICDQCDFKSVKKEHMKHHYFKGKHSDMPLSKSSKFTCEKYTCDRCVFQTMSPRKFSIHTYFKHGEGVDVVFSKNEDGIYQCDKCDFNTINTSSIKSHHFTGKHTALLERSCGKCSFVATTAISMKLHNYFNHGAGLGSEIEADSEGKLWCSKCDFSSTNETQYRYHLMLGDHKLTVKKDTALKSCFKCNFSTKYPGELIRHEFYKHGDGISMIFNADTEKMYTCQLCDYQTPKMSNIKTHHYNNHVKNSQQS